MLKFIGLVLALVILFPISPLILAWIAIHKIIKSALSKIVKLVLVISIVIFSLFLTGKIVGALPSSLFTIPKPEINPGKIESSPQGITTAKVIKVIDGDTFKIDSGETVRLIGIDTPETVHPTKPVECYGKEASLKTEELIADKEVKLEKDVSDTDKFGRLLRYVYVENVLINEYLVREGYAMSSSYPPDIKYQSRFIEAQKKAQEEDKGLWNPLICPTPTPKPVTL